MHIYLLKEWVDDSMINIVLERYWIKFQGALFVVSAVTETICPLGLKTYFFLAVECSFD